MVFGAAVGGHELHLRPHAQSKHVQQAALPATWRNDGALRGPRPQAIRDHSDAASLSPLKCPHSSSGRTPRWVPPTTARRLFTYKKERLPRSSSAYVVNFAVSTDTRSPLRGAPRLPHQQSLAATAMSSSRRTQSSAPSVRPQQDLDARGRPLHRHLAHVAVATATHPHRVAAALDHGNAVLPGLETSATSDLAVHAPCNSRPASRHVRPPARRSGPARRHAPCKPGATRPRTLGGFLQCSRPSMETTHPLHTHTPNWGKAAAAHGALPRWHESTATPCHAD